MYVCSLPPLAACPVLATEVEATGLVTANHELSLVILSVTPVHRKQCRGRCFGLGSEYRVPPATSPRSKHSAWLVASPSAW